MIYRHFDGRKSLFAGCAQSTVQRLIHRKCGIENVEDKEIADNPTIGRGKSGTLLTTVITLAYYSNY